MTTPCARPRRWKSCAATSKPAVDARRTGIHEERVGRLGRTMNQAGIDSSFSPARSAALLKEETTGGPAGAMVLADGRVVTGKTSPLLGAASSLLMNALKGGLEASTTTSTSSATT